MKSKEKIRREMLESGPSSKPRPLLLYRDKWCFCAALDEENEYTIDLDNGIVQIKGEEFLKDWDLKLEALGAIQLWFLNRLAVLLGAMLLLQIGVLVLLLAIAVRATS